VCPHHASTGEEGFTLIELVMVLIIMPLIVGAVAVVMITTLKATSDPNGTTARLAESNDEQITSTYFVRDVQNSTQITTQGSELCGSPVPPATQVLGLFGDGGVTTISYVVTTIGGLPTLVRYYCAAGESGTPTNTTTLSDTLTPATAVSVTLTCATAYSTTCSSDAAAALISSIDVAIVGITVNENSGFSFDLAASPRQSLGSTQSLVVSTPPLLLLGSGLSPTGGADCGPGNEGLTVNGVLAVSSSHNGSIRVGNQGLKAQQVYSPPIQGGGNPVSPPNAYTQQGAPPGIQRFVTGPTLGNPFASLPPPDPSAPKTFVYSTPLTTGNDGSGNLKSGVYILEDGIDASLASDPGGVFFYVTGGSVILGGSSSLNLSAMTSVGPYSGILLYQAPSDTQGLTLLRTPNVNSLDGVVAAPRAEATLNGAGSTISALGLVASSVVCNGFQTSGSFGPQTPTTTVSSSKNPSLSGQSVTFGATVTSNAGTVSGDVTFTVKSSAGAALTCTNGGNVQTLMSGQASCVTPPLTNAGSPYTVTADYPGTLGLSGSPSLPLSQDVRVPSSTVVSSSPSPSVSGQSVQFTAQVTGTATPTGTVTFVVTDKNHFPYSCVGGNAIQLSGGSAACTIAPGQFVSINSPFTVVANYGGDANNAPSSGPATQTVNPGSMHLALLGGVGSVPDRNGHWQATVNVRVLDGNNDPVGAVFVTGTWTPGAFFFPPGCPTGFNGQCSFTAVNINQATSETWTVVNLVVPGYVYEPTANVQNSVTISAF